MTAKDRENRLRAYARASKRSYDANPEYSGWLPRPLAAYVPGLCPALDLAREREHKAWLRLPATAQSQLLEPEGSVSR